MLDYDLASMYEVDVSQLKRQVRRNIERFPKDFMFELTAEEVSALRCQNGILKTGRGQHSKYPPFAFTEEGVVQHPTAGQQYCGGKTQNDDMAYILHNSVMFNGCGEDTIFILSQFKNGFILPTRIIPCSNQRLYS